jgi:hypothetical protein
MGFVSVRVASITALVILGSVVVFHVLVASGVLPKTIVWVGGCRTPPGSCRRRSAQPQFF